MAVRERRRRRPDGGRAGFAEVTVAPTILPALGHVAMWHDCRLGRIEAGWRLDGAAVAYTVTLPDGCHGRLLPNPRHRDVRLDGRAISVPPEGIPLNSGKHAITFDLTA